MGTVSLVSTLLGVHMRPCVLPRRHSANISSGPAQHTPTTTMAAEVSIEMPDLQLRIDKPDVAHARFRIEITDTGMHLGAIICYSALYI